MVHETIIVETRGKVGLITLNRPKALNALNSQVLAELLAAVNGFDANADIGAMVITGSEKAFAAGADIKEMQPKSYIDAFGEDLFARLNDRFAPIRAGYDIPGRDPAPKTFGFEGRTHRVGGRFIWG